MTEIFAPKVLDKLASKKNWAIDVDDCMYDIASGLHSHIKENIVRTYNAIAQNDPDKAKIVQTLSDILKTQNISIKNPEEISPEDLGLAFPPIVKALDEVKHDKLFDYLNQFYGDKYERIEEDQALVKAFTIAQEKGIGVHFYTNGPSDTKQGAQSHLQKIMQQRGFSEPMIEYMRSRTYDLLMQIEDGYGKPSEISMQNFLKFSQSNPRETLMADDGPKNLKTAFDAGIATIWTWTSDQEPKRSDIEIANQIGAPRIRNTGAALLEIAMAHE